MVKAGQNQYLESKLPLLKSDPNIGAQTNATFLFFPPFSFLIETKTYQILKNILHVHYIK